MLDVSVFPSISPDLAVGVGLASDEHNIGQGIAGVAAKTGCGDAGNDIENESFLISISELRYIMFVCIRWRLENSKELAAATRGPNNTSSKDGCNNAVNHQCSSSDSRIFFGRTSCVYGGEDIDDSTPAKGYLISNLFLYRSCVSDAQREELELSVIRSILALIDPGVESRGVRQSIVGGVEKETEEIYCAESRLCNQFLLKGLPVHYLRTLFGRDDGEVSFGDIVNWIEHSSGLNLANVASTPSVLGTLLKYFNVSWPNHVLGSLLFQNLDAQQYLKVEDEQQNVETLTLSLGSLTHVLGLCKPCVFVNKSNKKCRNGVMCCFCHFQHKERKRGKRYKGGGSNSVGGTVAAAAAFQSTGSALCNSSCGDVPEVFLAEGDSLSTSTDKIGKVGGLARLGTMPELGARLAPFSASPSVIHSSAFGSGMVSELETNSNVGGAMLVGGGSPQQHSSFQSFQVGVGFPDIPFASGDIIQRQGYRQQHYQQQQEVIKYVIPPPPPLPSRTVTAFSFQDEKDVCYEALNISNNTNPVATLASAGYHQLKSYENSELRMIAKNKSNSGSINMQQNSNEENVPFEAYNRMVSSNNSVCVGNGISKDLAGNCWMASSIDSNGVDIGGEMRIETATVAAAGSLNLSEEGGKSLYWPNCLEMNQKSLKSDSIMNLSILSPQWGGKGVTIETNDESSAMKMGFGFDTVSLTQNNSNEHDHCDSLALSALSFGLTQIGTNSICENSDRKEHDENYSQIGNGAKESFISSSMSKTFSQRGVGGDSLLNSWEIVVGGIGSGGLSFQMDNSLGMSIEGGSKDVEKTTLLGNEDCLKNVEGNSCGYFLDSSEFFKD
ncbi:hypothetical protein RS030_71111 [Cryptosporidium xiaoi]|uniref:C3H1-type domain-containing protein n=1 Tax=Cryptosporidium xiaoi TaxID=659607 RepID=A0AAV9XX72_9CRYT